MINCTVLIVDENRSDRETLRKLLNGEAGKVLVAENSSMVDEYLERYEVDILFLEMNFRAGISNGNEGMYWLRRIAGIDPDIVVIMMTASGNIELAVNAIREGAFDFISKPPDRSKVLVALNAAWQMRQSRIEAKALKDSNRLLRDEMGRSGERIILGASPTMISVMNMVRKVSATDANVLITGENGTGKELIAREIHNLSARKNEIMVSVDVGSLTETLFEAEMFGHVKGAFTDAHEDRKGKFEAARNGTLFLDEIGNLSPRSQAKLLTVLQSRRVVKVGSNREIPVNFRLVCATNNDLRRLISEGRFREDLFFRINTIMIEVPPLRDRVDDIPVLASHFLRTNAEKYGRKGIRLSTQALEKLMDYDWPGNVRELQHSIEKAVIMADSNILRPADFSFTSQQKVSSGDITTLEEMERHFIGDAIRKHGRNISMLAGTLGITRQTLYNKLRKYGL